MEKTYFHGLNPEDSWIMSRRQKNVLENILRLTQEKKLLWTRTGDKEFRSVGFIPDEENPTILYPVCLRSFVDYFEEYGIPVEIPIIELEVDEKIFSNNTPKHIIVSRLYREVSGDMIYTPFDLLQESAAELKSEKMRSNFRSN